MFCDEVELSVKAGNGGDGMVSFRRERYVPFGGPDGGDGGHGGNVIFQVNSHLTTLNNFRLKPLFEAKSGAAGSKYNCAGKAGEDLVLEVPIGTIVYELPENKKICDLSEEGGKYIICNGGRGGYGNAHFVSSTRQAPRFAEKGEPGEERKLRLELQMVADVGIIGFPSSGKSTLISHISNAKPKIGDYPFTTLVPNLGVVQVDDTSFVVADVPGLIEGASKGKGLGDRFLKHIKRTRTLVHLVDINDPDPGDKYKKINNELASYDKTIALKPQIVVLNKIDTVDDETVTLIKEDFCEQTGLKPEEVYAISGVSGKNVKPLLYKIIEIIDEHRIETGAVSQDEYKIFTPFDDNVNKRRFNIEKVGENTYNVTGKRIEQIAIMTDEKNDEARMRLYDVLKKMNILIELEKSGIKNGDTITIGAISLTYSDYL